MALVMMVSKLWGNSLGHYTEAADYMPRARESSGVERVGWNYGPLTYSGDSVRKRGLEMSGL